MLAIVMEGILFVALIAAGGALVFILLAQFTPLGRRLRESRNRRALERAASQVCPIHGPQRDEAMVRLPSGERICPECYQESLWLTR